MITIDNFNFRNKKALVRVDFNVPLNEAFAITDDMRMKGALPTINKILNEGGSAILMSHLGRPEGKYALEFSLIHLVKHLGILLNKNVIFVEDCVGEKAENATLNLKPGEVLLMENLRFHKEETEGNEVFSENLARLGDIYVNDAFGTAHRAHASTTIVAKFFGENKCFGYLMRDEILNIEKVLNNPSLPVTAILGGKKVSDKVLLIENLLPRVNNLLIGGAMTYTFVAALGGKTGNSLVEKDKFPLVFDLLNKAKDSNVLLLYATDSFNGNSFSNDALKQLTQSNNIPEGWIGLDIGAETIKKYSEIILESKTILWNGPMGVFEFPEFQKGSEAIAQAIAEATSNNAFSLIGGGDSVSAINQFGLANKVSYISSGGGAMLEFLEGKELPGIKAIND